MTFGIRALTNPPQINDFTERLRDRRAAIALLFFCWIAFAAFEQSPFKLQGAVLEALVERGRLYFIDGKMRGNVFENLETNTPSFRFLFNIFPLGDRYYVNHAPGQFLLAAPWYAACVKLGWRFETHERLVWRILVWTLTAPLGALGIMGIFLTARNWNVPWIPALLVSLVVGLCSPWWPASGVLYHDSLAVALILIAVTIWQYHPANDGVATILNPTGVGFLLAFGIVTTYLVIPIVLLISGFLVISATSRRDSILFGVSFLSTLSLLPIINTAYFGSAFATGYSAGGFQENYPSPFDLLNAWEKIGFYLWDLQYGLLALFPVFLLGAVGLTLRTSFNKPLARRMVIALATVHFLFIVSMNHHGSVGWGMGRFFLPLYPILAFGLPAIWLLEGWKGHVARAVIFATVLYSGIFAVAGVGYGVQGVMEPGFPSLKLRLMMDRYHFYTGSIWIALIAGMLAEALSQTFKTTTKPTVQGPGRHPRPRRKRK